MRLNLVRPRTGLAWAKQGVRVFFRQPLAMSGLFFLFMALLSVASLLPFIGSALALALLPAATLGLMAATREAEHGKFPMPTILATAFRAGRQRARAMMALGAFYAVGFLLLLGVSTLFDGGGFAHLYLFGGKITQELVNQPEFQMAMWAAMLMYLPLSLLFWHAPALVHWHDVSPAKSMFFSFMACWKNFGAFLVFGLVWLAFLMIVGLTVTLVATLLGSPEFAAVAMFPAVLVLVSMFFSSLYFTFRDSFSVDEDAEHPRIDAIV
jgi:hypothetical protein